MSSSKLTNEAIDYYSTSDEFWDIHEAADSTFKVWVVDSLLKKAGIELPADLTAAEVGCGQGAFLLPLADYLSRDNINFHLSGYDISSKAIQLAKTKSKYPEKSLAFHLAPAEEIPHQLDFIFCVDVLEHVENPWEILRQLAKKSKYLILHLPIEQSFGHMLLKRPTRSNKNLKHIHFYSLESAMILIKESPFEVVDYEFTAASSAALKFGLTIKASILAKALKLIRYCLYKVSPQLAAIFGGGNVMFLLRNSSL